MDKYNFKHFLIGHEGSRILIRLKSDKTSIGSSKKCDRNLIENNIREQHCLLKPYRENGFIKGLSEEAEIKVNGEPVIFPQVERVKSNDKIKLGTLELRYYVIKNQIPTVDLEKPTAIVKPIIRPSQPRKTAPSSSRRTGR